MTKQVITYDGSDSKLGVTTIIAAIVSRPPRTTPTNRRIILRTAAPRVGSPVIITVVRIELRSARWAVRPTTNPTIAPSATLILKRAVSALSGSSGRGGGGCGRAIEDSGAASSGR